MIVIDSFTKNLGSFIAFLNIFSSGIFKEELSSESFKEGLSSESFKEGSSSVLLNWEFPFP